MDAGVEGAGLGMADVFALVVGGIQKKVE